MTKKLAKIGNSYGIILEKSLLDMLRIDPETPLEILTDGDNVVIKPQRPNQRDEVDRISEAIMDEHAATFRKLAD